MKPHVCSFHLYTCNFFDNKENYIYSGFLSPRIAYVRKGSCIVKTKTETLQIKEGSVWYLPRFYPYSSHWTAASEVDFDVLEFEIPAFDLQYRELQIFQELPLGKAFFDLKNAIQSGDEFSSLSAFYAIISAIKPYLTVTERDIPPSIAEAVKYITENYKADIRVADLAKDCFLSESRFYYLFKKATGQSPIDFKNHIKIVHAANALRGGATLENICEEYGFCSPAFFRRLLKKFTGKGPSAYKKEYEKL